MFVKRIIQRRIHKRMASKFMKWKLKCKNKKYRALRSLLIKKRLSMIRKSFFRWSIKQKSAPAATYCGESID